MLLLVIGCSVEDFQYCLVNEDVRSGPFHMEQRQEQHLVQLSIYCNNSVALMQKKTEDI